MSGLADPTPEANPGKKHHHRGKGKSQKVIRHRLLRWHAARVLRSSLKHAIPAGRAALEAISRFHHDAAAATIAAADIPVTPGEDTGPGVILGKFEDGCDISAAITVVGRGPDGDDGRVEHLLETFHDKLMSTGNQAEVVAVVEHLDDVCTEEEPGATR